MGALGKGRPKKGLMKGYVTICRREAKAKKKSPDGARRISEAQPMVPWRLGFFTLASASFQI
ncbi:MAG TPA: hypothetical protein DDZ51_31045 [Planctomycetaceae bacterium]|nr:hypothetical protein [Planctomycetaceae bacterium]